MQQTDLHLDKKEKHPSISKQNQMKTQKHSAIQAYEYAARNKHNI